MPTQPSSAPTQHMQPVVNVSEPSAFGVSLDELKSLMETRGPEALEKLRSFGGIAGLCERLRTTQEGGLDGEPNDLRSRVALFGANILPPKPPKTFLQLMFEAASDTTLIILMAAAGVSFLLSFYNPSSGNEKLEESSGEMHWIDSAAILAAVLVVTVVTAFNDWQKERQFRGLKARIESEQHISVVRAGELIELPIAEIVVGDVLQLKYGDLLPTDALVLRSNDLKVDEAALTGESDLVRKGADIDPVLLSGTHVMEGGARALVVAVGLNSQAGIIYTLLGAAQELGDDDDDDDNEEKTKKPDTPVAKKDRDVESARPRSATNNGNSSNNNNNENNNKNLNASANSSALTPVIEEACGISGTNTEAAGNATEEEAKPKALVTPVRKKEKSVLQNKLTQLAIQIGYAGTVAAVGTVLILLARFALDTYILKKKGWEAVHVKTFINSFVIGITVLVVAVPEGLPLAVTLALAYSVKGTLTTNRMTVVSGFLGDSLITGLPGPAWVQRFSPRLCWLLSLAISVNSAYTSRVIADKKGGLPQQMGNKTECALLSLAETLGYDYEAVRHQYPESSFLKVYTFNSIRKSMTTIIGRRQSGSTAEAPGGNNVEQQDFDGFIVLSKGASEIILSKCSYILDEQGEPQVLDESEKERVISEVIESMASQGLRTICLAYRPLTPSPTIAPRTLNEMAPLSQWVGGDWDDEAAIVNDLTCIGIVGIEDPVRPEVPAAIRRCQGAGITVRMVTGDNVNTARSIAYKCGILNQDLIMRDGVVLEGRELNNRIRDKSGQVRQELLDEVWPNLRVLARSSPQDKYTLVKGIIESRLSINREVVAVTGDGTNDGPALRQADVGFAMGISGTDVAKEASDIIITDDNFSSIVQAVKWGRNVYDSISKFLQFQLTVNVVAVTLAFGGSLFASDSPLKAIQMLWVNLIMDTMASLALATELPTEHLLKRKPYGRTKPLLSRRMVKHIALHSIFQLIIVFGLLLYGDELLDVESAREMETGSAPTQHFTVLFTSFVLMTLFNEINARKLHGERNVFAGLHTNPLFLGIWISTFIFQIILTQFGGRAFSTAPLTLDQWLWCIFFGVSSLAWGQIVATIPLNWVPKHMPFVRRPAPRRASAYPVARKSLTGENARNPNSVAERESLHAAAAAVVGEEGEGVEHESDERPPSEEEAEEGDQVDERGQVLWLRGLTRLQTQMQAMQVVQAFRMNMDAASLSSLERRLSALPAYAPLTARIRKQSQAAAAIRVRSVSQRTESQCSMTSLPQQANAQPTRQDSADSSAPPAPPGPRPPPYRAHVAPTSETSI